LAAVLVLQGYIAHKLHLAAINGFETVSI